MSWSAYRQNPARGADLTGFTTSPEALTPEMDEQFTEAKRVAGVIIESGVVGDPQGWFNISLSGHANPGHKPAEGWANDSCVVNIYQATPPKENV